MRSALGGRAAVAVLAVVVVDHEADRGVARVDLAPQLGLGVDVLHDVEVLARRHLRDELAAVVRAVLVEDDRLQVLDVVVDRVAEDERLQDRDHHDHPERDRVAAELEELLADEGEKALHRSSVRPPPAAPEGAALRASDTNTSSSEGSAASGAPKRARSRAAAPASPARATARRRTAEEVGVLEARIALHGRERREGLGPERDLEEAAGERALQLGRAARGDEPAVEDEGEAVALLGLVHVVRRDEDGHAALGRELVDEVPEEAPALRVDAAGRLVEEEELRLVEERRGERDALALAGREVLRELAEERLEAKARGELADTLGEAERERP